MMRIRWQSGSGDYRAQERTEEATLPVAAVASQDNVVVFLDANSQPLLVITQYRLIDAVDVPSA